MFERRIFAALTLALFLGACGVSNHVTTGKGIQKRKYTKGFYKRKTERVVTAKNDLEVEEEVSVMVAEVPELQPSTAVSSDQTSNPIVNNLDHPEKVVAQETQVEDSEEIIEQHNVTVPVSKRTQRSIKRPPIRSRQKASISEPAAVEIIVPEPEENDRPVGLLILGLLLILLLPIVPIGFGMAVGAKDPRWQLNSLLWLGGAILEIAGLFLAVAEVATGTGAVTLGWSLVIAGGIVLLFCIIHAIACIVTDLARRT